MSLAYVLHACEGAGANEPGGSTPPAFDDVAKSVEGGRRGSNINDDAGGSLSSMSLAYALHAREGAGANELGGSMPPAFGDAAKRVGGGRSGSNMNDDAGGSLSSSFVTKR